MKAIMAEGLWAVRTFRAAWRVYWIEARYAWTDTQSVDATVRRARFRMLLWGCRAARAHDRAAGA